MSWLPSACPHAGLRSRGSVTFKTNGHPMRLDFCALALGSYFVEFSNGGPGLNQACVVANTLGNYFKFAAWFTFGKFNDI